MIEASLADVGIINALAIDFERDRPAFSDARFDRQRG